MKSCFLYTGFGSALNIETLVAAAERRETPIEVLALTVFCHGFLSLLLYAPCWILLHLAWALSCLMKPLFLIDLLFCITFILLKGSTSQNLTQRWL